MSKKINVDQAVILKKFKKWLSIKAKQEPDNFSEKKVEDLIKSFEHGYCSGFSWLHRIQKQQGAEQLYFYQIKKIANWNGKEKSLDPDLDRLFNQFTQIAVFAHQAWATEAATSTGAYYDGGNSLDELNRSLAAAEGLIYDQTDSIIGRSLAQAEQAFVITNFENNYESMNKEQTRQKIESLFKDNVNAMLYVAGQCYSKRNDPSKHEYHAIDLGISEVNGSKKYWLYDPNHPKGTRYFNSFDELFKGLQKAFFYKSHHNALPLQFQRYESLEFEQKNFEISLKSTIPRNQHSIKHKNADKSKGHSKRKSHHKSSNSRKTLTFTDAHKSNKPSTFDTLHNRKIAELTEIIEQIPTNSRIELAIRNKYKTIQIEKLENGFALWLSEDKEKVVVNDLQTLFRLIKEHDKNFWDKSNIVTIFTKQFTEESKQKASLELALAIEAGMLDTVKWCIENGALEKFNPTLEKHHGHNPLTLALIQSKPNLDIIQMIVKYDLQHNLGLSDHIMNAPGSQQGLNVVWFALLTGNTDILNCIKTNYPDKQYNPMNEGVYEGLSPLDVIKNQRPPSFVEAVSKCYPDMLTSNPQQRLSNPKN